MIKVVAYYEVEDHDETDIREAIKELPSNVLRRNAPFAHGELAALIEASAVRCCYRTADRLLKGR